MQKRALKTIFGYNKCYSDILKENSQETLFDRRKKMFDKFAQKTSKNPRYAEWFPPTRTNPHNTRNTDPFLEEYARTDRYKHSPVFEMRSRLNKIHRDTTKSAA